MSAPNCKINITGKDGGEAWIEGDPATIEAVERALAYAGARWNKGIECWDFGFYNTPGDGTHVGNAARTHCESWVKVGALRDQTHLALKQAVDSAEAHLRKLGE